MQEVERDAEKGDLDTFLKLSESRLEVPFWESLREDGQRGL